MVEHYTELGPIRLSAIQIVSEAKHTNCLVGAIYAVAQLYFWPEVAALLCLGARRSNNHHCTQCCQEEPEQSNLHSGPLETAPGLPVAAENLIQTVTRLPVR